jgi:mannitol-1-phosphate/altronate dehydrogenase
MDELNQAQQQIADRVGELLAESPLDEEVKEVLLEGIDKLPKELLFKLLDVLENERESLEKVAFEVKLFLKEQDANWEQTARDQQEAADTIADAWAEKLRSTTE